MTRLFLMMSTVSFALLTAAVHLKSLETMFGFCEHRLVLSRKCRLIQPPEILPPLPQLLTLAIGRWRVSDDGSWQVDTGIVS